ncbi:p-loop containing nucleoside triphosphate hydrolase protein [Rutstroemia sp. NJR-2017a BVV2]|nr:p-loop containing nucleoside triphosphate hydrolase protein [Rutstroemia sp. NJR-2017a BVV2]
MDPSRSLRYIISHVFLPPKLPQKDDNDVKMDIAIMEECKEALRSFQAHISPPIHWRWAVCGKMLHKMLEIRDGSGDMMSGKVEESLASMIDRDVLAFHIRGQNAGLIVRKKPKQFSFESFELLPTTKSVMQTKGRLRRCFPGSAVAICRDRIADRHFREALAQLLVRLDVDTPNEAWPVTSKAGSKTIEVRDSIHPKFITEMLTGILRGVGQPLEVVRIHKRTRDDVVWRDAYKPWRRSPLWLLLRVALQTTLMIDPDDLHEWYKSFMIFFMAHILQRAREAALPSDLLFVMVAKISRRSLKLAIADEPRWMERVRSTVEATQQELVCRWNRLERNPDPFATQKAWDSIEMCFPYDTSLSLLTLRPYLQTIAARGTAPSDHRNFTPNCPRRIEQRGSLFPEQRLLSMGGDPAARLSLADLELWVQDQLDAWLATKLDSQSSCTVIADLIDHYTITAASTYKDNPQDISLMILTLMDLWAALDKCSVYHYPLLSKYYPGFPLSLFDPLLLPKRRQMERLAVVEQYLTKRKNQASSGFLSIFQNINASNSLAVQYFEQSLEHQQLRSRIESEAQADRDRRKSKLTKMKQQYCDLIRDSNSRECEFEVHWERSRKVSRHSYRCRKCQLKATAKKLSIAVHEWPLPQSDLEAMSTVFELDVPTAIARWRDTTYSLLVDTLSPHIPSHPHKTRKVYRMDKFNGLEKYFHSRAARLQLASTTKSFTQAHYCSKPVSQATETNICVNNGLQYAMYDSRLGHWTEDLLGRCNVQRICTLQLPLGPYRRFQFALDGTTHTSNDVLAKQSECPKSLSLHEFYAFATLRAGDRLQWRNIARELVSRVLNFSHEETYMLVVQAAWQVGRSRDGRSCRESHIDLEEQEFGMSLLSVLEDALGAIEGNWQGAAALRTFVILASRLLSMSHHEMVQNRCVLFLRRARKAALEWVRDVSQLLDESQGAEEWETLNLRLLEMALTCHGTFNADECYIFQLLKSHEDITTVTECSITVHDRCPAVINHLPQHIKTLIEGYRRLCHLLEPSIRRNILADRSGIDHTLRRLWKGYQPGSRWAALEKPHQRWLVTRTSDKDGYSPVTIHYDTLDGSLLVNGTPLTRLPQSYELHTTYRRIFGQKVLDVIPSTMEGMVFETRKEIFGQQVHFAEYGSELIIRTRRQRQVCELLPICALKDDFPRSLVEDYTHWLDINTRSVEWRPLNHPWTSSPDNWQMRVDCQGTFVLNRDMQELIDVRSRTAKAIARVLSPLEYAAHIHIISNCKTRVLEIHLPRLKLDFFFNDRQRVLESKQFRSMVVDEQQSFGAFTGLVNKLVLRDIEGTSRSVIVPYGSVSFAQDGHHVRVTIDTTPAIRVKYHLYSIDRQLGRLVDNGSLQSRLFRLYLHGTTSHCLIDRLTGRTGTEEALFGLAGAATRSFVELEPIDIELLEMLAQLTPRRQFYPKHLRVMQQVEWATLSPLSQHCAFQKQVASIFGQANAFQVFQERPVEPLIPETRGEQFLLERAAIRDSSFQVHEFGAEAFTANDDTVYTSRDQTIDSARELQTCRIAKLVDYWSANLTICPRLLLEIESWGGVIKGPSLEDNLMIGFDLKWLDAPTKFMPDYWYSLHAFLSQSIVERDKYKIMVFLSTLAYSPHAKPEFIQTLLAFATIPRLRVIQPPKYPVFQLAEGYQPIPQKLVNLVEQYTRPFTDCDESKLPILPEEECHIADERRKGQHQIAKERQVEEFVEDLVAQWPKAKPSMPKNTNHDKYILVNGAVNIVCACFQNWHRNAQFQKFINQAQSVLDQVRPVSLNLHRYSFSLPASRYVPRRRYLSFSDLIKNPAPCLPTADQELFDQWIIRERTQSTDKSKLTEILDHLKSSHSSEHELQYAEDLEKSFHALCKETSINLKLPLNFNALLESNRTQAQKRVDTVYQMICSHLQISLCHLARTAQMTPRLSPISVLACLASEKLDMLPCEWKKTLIEYGLSIAELQRAERLLTSAQNTIELSSEVANPGHRDWDPLRYPEWLLVEVENHILIRPDQAQISRDMMSPSLEKNSVMQLNMGLGKSSVIVPIVAAALANRTQLVRVIVLKPLVMQMFHLLVKKLGGMLNRRIFYMPISRSLRLDVRKARQIRDLYEECMQVGGILLLQPEHILSFELMGLERLLSGDAELGSIMVQTQDWLRANTRDILDESDEILSVRFELIYTIGEQRSLQFSPDRWVIIEQVLGLLGDAASQFQARWPHGLEVVPAQPGGFPRIRILQSPAGKELLEHVASELCEVGLPGVPVCYFSAKVRKALLEFLTNPELTIAEIQSLREAIHGSELMSKGVLLLKGLFADRILEFALEQKRWRVNYGLDPSRTMLAVPYHAKDSPTERSEFSHPDAAIVLTCLAYYYGGISDQQLRVSFEALFRSDRAEEEYAKWIKDAPGLAPPFKEISGINLSNTEQCSREVFPALKFARSVINFYMSTVVFPAEMKEFPHKLSSSGWDIAGEKAHPTTGFSGTNDSRYILPLSISQCDLPAQLSTNAAVLDCLLRTENFFLDASHLSPTGILDAEVLLELALHLKPPVRVILDVGAQVLELQNEEMAHKWLSRVPKSEAQAAIFFDPRNEICVLSRDGTKEPFQMSPFAKQMDQCLVYLDESHTRGTDLRMPSNYRAIVTLGPGLTKDRLVQACMRMRKLGNGQSVVFCSSMEIQRKMRERSGGNCDVIEVADVIKWCIAETNSNTRKSIPLWATQGVRHQRRQAVYTIAAPQGLSRELVESLLEREAQSLEQRYGEERAQYEEQILSQNMTDELLMVRNGQLNEIRTKCREFDIASFNTATLQEQQEREISPENEREQQVELPPASSPFQHYVHSDVRLFITRGILKRSSNAFQPAFETFRRTTALTYYDSKAWPDELLVTVDFANTIQAPDSQLLDSFLRPVHWIASCRGRSAIECVVLSPYEAQELLPSLRQSKVVTLHTYSPRSSVSMRTLEDLSFCAIPAAHGPLPDPNIIRHLNLFAGQLYIRDFGEYTILCQFLGLCSQPPDDSIQVACDGFIYPASRANSESIMLRACSFTASPVQFLRMVIAFRRKGQSFASSHFGKILNGQLVGKNEF